MFRIVEQGSPAYDAALADLRTRGQSDLERVEAEVRAIIQAVRRDGDAALIELAQRFEQRAPAQISVPQAQWPALTQGLAPEVRAWLQAAAKRIADYHEHQKQQGFRYEQ